MISMHSLSSAHRQHVELMNSLGFIKFKTICDTKETLYGDNTLVTFLKLTLIQPSTRGLTAVKSAVYMAKRGISMHCANTMTFCYES